MAFAANMKLFAFVCGFLAVAAQTPQSEAPKKPALEGVVLQEGGGQPVTKPTLTLVRVDKPSFNPPKIEGQADGTFRFPDLEAGTYSVIAEKAGFASRAYGGKNDGSLQGIPIRLLEGETRKIEIRLVKHGLIAGRVLDPDSEPIQNAVVMAMKKTYVRGTAIWLPSGTPVQSNDLGEFRLTGLAASKYLVCAIPMSNLNPAAAAPSTPASKAGEKPSAIVTTCYPNIPDRSQAMAIELKDGMEMPNMDIHMARRTVASVKGQIIGLPPNAPQMIPLSLTPKGLGPGSLIWGNRAFPTATEGKFEFKNVTPGQYYLQTIPLTLGAATFGLKQSIDVGEDPIEGLQVPSLTPFDVKGKFVAAEGELPPLAGARLILTTVDEIFNSVPMANISEKPEFTLTAVFPDRYYINATGLPEGVYIKHVKCADRVSDERQVEIISASEPMEIVLGLDGGAISGGVADAKSEPVRGAWVALIHDSRKVYRRTARADEKGQFTMKGVVPGDYRIFAVESLDPGAVDDDEYLKQWLSGATRLKIEPKAQQSISIKVQSAQ